MMEDGGPGIAVNIREVVRDDGTERESMPSCGRQGIVSVVRSCFVLGVSDEAVIELCYSRCWQEASFPDP